MEAAYVGALEELSVSAQQPQNRMVVCCAGRGLCCNGGEAVCVGQWWRCQ